MLTIIATFGKEYAMSLNSRSDSLKTIQFIHFVKVCVLFVALSICVLRQVNCTRLIHEFDIVTL